MGLLRILNPEPGIPDREIRIPAIFFLFYVLLKIGTFNTISRSSLGLKGILKMPGLEPGTSQLSMLSESAYHLRYIPGDPSAHTHSISGPDLAGLPGLQYYTESA